MPLADALHTCSGGRDVLLDTSIGHTSAAGILSAEYGISTSPTAVRRWRSHNDVYLDPTPKKGAAAEAVAPPNAKIRAEEDTESLTVYHDSWPVELGEDLSPLVEFFGYDPANFEVVDDTVKMSKWQTSKGNDSGGRDVIWLYSYRAKFRRIQEPLNANDDLDAALARIQQGHRLIRRTLGSGLGAPVIYVHQQGDEQIGKREGGGIAGVTERVEEVVQQSYDRLRRLLKAGANVTEILDVANGDTVENIFGHYPSQQRTTATLRKQMKAGRDLDIFRTQSFAEFGLPITKAYCTDNHGEIRQSIGLAPFTSESDNLTLILAETVRDVLDQSTISDQITWKIPHDEWWTLVTIGGLNIAVGHGHKASGKLEEWVRKQRDYLHFHHDFRADLALLGHKHHFLTQDISGTTLLQTPSLDGGSPFFAAMQGNVSRAGVITYLAGPQFNQHFSDLVVL